MISKNLQSIFRVFPFPVIVVFFLAAIVRFFKLGEFDNSYYSATVMSMLESPKNFFFGAFDPGGYVSVDKPPFAFWIQAFFAFILGINAWTLGLPQLIAGLCVLLFVYKIIVPTFGKIAGISAMTVLAFLPVVLVIDTRNEPDGILSLLLISATYSLIRGVKTNSYIWLTVFSIFIGLAFNTKMFVAFIPVPAFFLYLFWGSRERLMPTIKKAFLIIIVAGVVSLSWPLAVFFTPEHSRPYVGSTNDNSIWTLIFEYNGIRRFGEFNRPPPRNPVGLVNNVVQSSPMQVQVGQNLPQQRTILPNIQENKKNPIMLLSNNLASQLGWFFPVSLLGFIVIIRRTIRRFDTKAKLIDIFRIRGDVVFAEAWLWGGLVFNWSYCVFISCSNFYSSILSCGFGNTSFGTNWACC